MNDENRPRFQVNRTRLGEKRGALSIVDAIVVDVSKFQHEIPLRHNAPKLWTNEKTGRLGFNVRTEVMVQCLTRVDASNSWTSTKIARSLYQRMKKSPLGLPRRIAGPGDRATASSFDGTIEWDGGSFVNWLFRRIAPREVDIPKMVPVMAAFFAEKLWPSVDPSRLQEVFESKTSNVRTFIEQVLEHADLSHCCTWTAPYGFEPLLSNSFTVEPKSADPTYLKGVAKTARNYLRQMEGPRAYFVSGAPFTGKKTVLRYFLASCRGYRLQLADGTLLPIFATSLSDQSTAAFVDNLWRFYAGAQPRRDRIIESLARASIRVKLERIAEMAETTPACILLADTDPIEEDDVLRAITQDHACAAVMSLLRADGLTRLLLTTGEQTDKYRLRREAMRLSDYVAGETLRTTFPLNQMLRRLPASDQTEVSGTTRRLLKICSALAARSSSPLSVRDIELEQEHLALKKDERGLARLIWSKLLNDPERLLVGLISISHDGLRLSVLQRLLAALAALYSPTRSLAGVDADALFAALKAIEDVVIARTVAIDAALQTEGSDVSEPLYTVDPAWRKLFLELWWNADVSLARTAHWLVAREAAAQSRVMRAREFDVPSSAGAGRDVQALHALIASIDPLEIVRDAGPASPTDNLEMTILPPLDISVPKPDALSTLRYAYLYLYSRDIEGRDYDLITVTEDAGARLSILLPLFEPGMPWRNVTDRALAASIDEYPHLNAALTPQEIIELLVSLSIGAVRLQRYRLASLAVRIGEEVFRRAKTGSVSSLTFMRLVRSEIDAAILLGGNPEKLIPPHAESASSAAREIAKGPELGSLEAISGRIQKFLDETFGLPHAAPGDDLLLARGKLLARLGEVYHLQGDLDAAQEAFDAAGRAELEVLRLRPLGRDLSPVMGGRGARRQLRFLVDVARRNSWSTSWGNFIFEDELSLPTPSPVSRGKGDLSGAERILAACARRSSLGRVEDAIGLKIDAARLAAAELNFAHALDCLDIAETSMRFTSGSSLEFLLEFFAVRCRILIDAAILCLIKSAPGAVFHWDDRLEHLRRNLGLVDDELAEILASRLLSLARSAKNKLDRLVDLQRHAIHPYFTFSSFIEAILLAAESRIRGDEDEVRRRHDIVKKLHDAKYHVDRALHHMDMTSYRMHKWDAVRLADGIARALDFYERNALPT